MTTSRRRARQHPALKSTSEIARRLHSEQEAPNDPTIQLHLGYHSYTMALVVALDRCAFIWTFFLLLAARMGGPLLQHGGEDSIGRYLLHVVVCLLSERILDEVLY